MFFGLLAVDDHPCCNMQVVVEAFFLNSIGQSVYASTLFPEWIWSTLKKKSCGLNKSFKSVHALLHAEGVHNAHRQEIYDQVKSTNSVEALCDALAKLGPSVIVWNSELGKAIDSLMLSLYASLDLAIFLKSGSSGAPTHQLYDEFIQKNNYVCPFCGLDRFKNRRGARREDFDHYLHKSDYPLAAANMKNLVPTCGTCNQDYKKAKDILADGMAFYPYAEIPEVKLKIACQAYPDPGSFDDEGQWVVNLELAIPDPAVAPKLLAWDRVYSIKQRLENEIKEFFEDWMKEVTDDLATPVDTVKFRELIASARDAATESGLRRMQPGQIVRAAFYDFILSHAPDPFIESFRLSLNGRCA